MKIDPETRSMLEWISKQHERSMAAHVRTLIRQDYLKTKAASLGDIQGETISFDVRLVEGE